MPDLKRLAAGLAILAICAAAPAAAQEGTGPDWLFVLQGTVTQISDTTLSIHADPHVVAFTDRPDRLARLTNVQTLALAWGEGEPATAAPPNASLVNEADGEIGIVELADLSGGAGDVTVTFALLEGALPAVGDRIALTIDGLSGLFDYSKLLKLKSLKSL